jgi:hypothetical protein
MPEILEFKATVVVLQVRVPEVVAVVVGIGLIETLTVFELTQLNELVPVTVYTVATVGVTEIDEVVAPVLHV